MWCDVVSVLHYCGYVVDADVVVDFDDGAGVRRSSPAATLEQSPVRRTLLALVFCLTHLLNGVRSSFVLLGAFSFFKMFRERKAAGQII